MAGRASILLAALLVFTISTLFAGILGDVMVALEMPRFAFRGKSVTLKCVHDVPPDLLYKVEWLRDDTKIFQYKRQRKPPFRNFTVLGAEINMAESNSNSIVLDNLEFNASGTYYCEVTLDTPIYTKTSPEKSLIVIQAQRQPPRITFGASLYSVGETIEANCTTSPAHPSPQITWFINGQKVDPSLSKSYTRLAPLYRARKRYRSARQSEDEEAVLPQVGEDNNVLVNGNTNGKGRGKSCSAREVYGVVEHYRTNPPRRTLQQLTEEISKHMAHHKGGANGLHHTGSGIGAIHELVEKERQSQLLIESSKPPLGHRLSVTISALRVVAAGRLSLTCLSTIPNYRGPHGKYADIRNHTVIVDVVIPEVLDPEPTEAALSSAESASKLNTIESITKLLSTLLFTSTNFIVYRLIVYCDFDQL